MRNSRTKKDKLRQWKEKKETKPLFTFTKPKAKEWEPYPNATPGTLEYYRNVYYTRGIRPLYKEFMKLYRNNSPKSIETKLNIILFGTDRNGRVLEKPMPPDPKLMSEDLPLWKYQNKVFNDYK